MMESPAMVAPNPRFEFRDDYVTPHANLWRKLLKQFVQRDSLHFLEIGSHEGRSACWWLENILTGRNCRLTCIDSWTWKDGAEVCFDRVISTFATQTLVTKIKEESRYAIPSLNDEEFDFIYIDGSHEARDVLLDALLSLPKLKPEGILLFDDYQWRQKSVEHLPAEGIDVVLKLCQNQIQVIHRGYQLAIRKRNNTDE